MNTLTISEQKPLCMGLYTLYEADIQRARQALLTHMNKHYGTSIGVEIMEILYRRIQNSTTPLQGEMWPQFLKRIFPMKSANETRFYHCTLAWYALYMSVVIVDDMIDKGSNVNGIKLLMPLLVEASPLTADADSSRRAVIGQLADIARRPNPEKNAFIASLAKEAIKFSFLSDFMSDKPKASVITSLKNFLCGPGMMLISQVLDDIGDFEEDLRRGHPSLLVNETMLAKKHLPFVKMISDPEIELENFLRILNEASVEADTLSNLLYDHSGKEFGCGEEAEYFRSLSIKLGELTELTTMAKSGNFFAGALLKAKMDILAQST